MLAQCRVGEIVGPSGKPSGAAANRVQSKQQDHFFAMFEIMVLLAIYITFLFKTDGFR
jgi:hypothetical protein